MKKFFRLTCSIIFAITALSIFIVVYNKVLDRQIDTYYKDEVASYYGKEEKNKGLMLQKIGIKKDNFMFYGSSELGSDVPQNPTKFFLEKKSPFVVNIVGRGYSQDLAHIMNLGALGEELRGKKIGFIVSMQWFFSADGINQDNFLMNFSELQFYKFLNNDNLSINSKKYTAERVYALTSNKKDYQLPHIYSKLYLKENIVSKVGYYVLKPYFLFREQQLILNDKIKTVNLLKSSKPKSFEMDNARKIDWNSELESAEIMGKKAATNNEFYIEDNYYDKYIKENLNIIKDYYKNVDLAHSEEYKDFEELLKVCKELDIKPFFIIMPVNGDFYDYQGLSKEERSSYYSKIEEMVKKYEYNALNLEDKEYEPYLMVDSMHLGWKGWLYIDEKIYNYYKKN